MDVKSQLATNTSTVSPTIPFVVVAGGVGLAIAVSGGDSGVSN